MKSVLIVGAGRLGKGFVGETFYNAKWDISFLDNDSKVIDELNKEGKYSVRVHKTSEVVTNEISGYKAFLTDGNYAVLNNFLKSDLVMLPLYPSDFEEAAKYLSKCFDEQYKVKPESKKTLICLTNKNHIIDEIIQYFRENLADDEVRKWFDKNVVIRDSIVRRSTDAESNYSTQLITTAVASLIIQGPVHSNFEDVEWLDIRENVEILKDIKVFTINGPHAATAYYGYLKGYKDIPSAQENKDIAQLIKGVHDATIHAVLYEFPVTRDEIRELEYLPEAKNEMPDSIYRVAYDPIRKISPHDRFMGVIDLCEKYEIDYTPIAKAIAAALLYDEKRDPSSQKIIADVKKMGITETISKYIGREKQDRVVEKITDEYVKLQQEVG